MPSAHHGHELVLSSRSPRRRRLLAWLGVPFTATHADVVEDLTVETAGGPSELAVQLAVDKVRATRPEHPDAVILGFDTVVVLEGRVLGKPTDEQDARRMLAALSGGEHTVITGCAVLGPHGAEPVTFPVATCVRMHDLDAATIDAWLARGEYLGCAGAYNIEAQIASVTDDECFQNVAGLPLCHLYCALRDPALSPCVPAGILSPLQRCDASLGRRCRLGRRLTEGRGCSLAGS